MLTLVRIMLRSRRRREKVACETTMSAGVVVLPSALLGDFREFSIAASLVAGPKITGP